MTPKDAPECVSCIQSEQDAGINSSCHCNGSTILSQLKEKNEKILDVESQLALCQRELAMADLNIRIQQQNYLEKEKECEKIKEIRDLMLDNKDKELQDARDLIEDLKRQNRLLSKEINKSEEPVVELEQSQEDLSRIEEATSSAEEDLSQMEEATSSAEEECCPYCQCLIPVSQGWTFHFDNCPDSLMWRGYDTNHLGYYQRVSSIRGP
ncbi:hypothetical protein BSL78_20481 [Apostichopus japonicus]|uniref:Uncharacterized protein n=1 Tax=Stichopus japonicus TaxID=307972 RepID=A0A2G8K3T1_STIJA|nr:hypothetical protein BSL78_20481 [Apostichopus japonicus]